METTTSYNIIGDIHAKACWTSLVREDCVNIFVGDYFDPYEDVSIAECLFNFQEILEYKRQHPRTVLLYGNHDLHYMITTEHYSRYKYLYANDYRKTFIESRSLFHGIAYPIADKALVTHAGVTKEWYEKYFGEYQSEPLAKVAEKINDLWNRDKQAFTFEANATDPMDCYGTSPTHSPVWIRSWILVKHDLFEGTQIKQIFGHTRTNYGVTFDHNLVCVDCLDTRERSFIFE